MFLSKGQRFADCVLILFSCLFLCVPQKLNEHAAALFETGEETEVNAGLSIMNELVVACIPLLLVDEMEEKDMVAVEDMRNRWCSYLGQEMERKSSGWDHLESHDLTRSLGSQSNRFSIFFFFINSI